MKKFFTLMLITAAITGVIALSRYDPDIQTASASFGRSKSIASSNIKYRDGRYTGQTVDVGYGPVQVRAHIKHGKIIDIKFLQMPNDKDRTIEVTNMAKPLLRSETLAVQSADVDIVSGATQTSEGYVQSLQDALAEARL
jgi:uncharacterized protein with FMN-binding domain